MESNFNVGDKVVILEAYPPTHNGKVAFFHIHKAIGSVVFLNDTKENWYCLRIRHATLLEKELAET